MSDFLNNAEVVIHRIARERDYEILSKNIDRDMVEYGIRTQCGDCIIRFSMVESGFFTGEHCYIYYYRCNGTLMHGVAYNGLITSPDDVLSEINFDHLECEVHMIGEDLYDEDSHVGYDDSDDSDEEFDEEFNDENDDNDSDYDNSDNDHVESCQSNEEYYAVLNLRAGASQSEIRIAYVKMSKKYHPDINKSKNAKEKMQEINEAYNALKAA